MKVRQHIVRYPAGKFWWFFLHNAIAHPLCVLPFDWTVRFHDWTADKLD